MAVRGLSVSTFYPYKDAYRDTVTARGTRNEAASVAIKIVSVATKAVTITPATTAAPRRSRAWRRRPRRTTPSSTGT